MSIKRLKDFPEGSGSLSNDDIFLFMDNPTGSGVTKKISLSQIASAIGGGGGGGGGLSDSDRYIICKAGDDILAKYSAAKLLTPAGSSLSSTNRAYLIIMPGVYPLSAQWEIDAEFVDVIGLGSTPLDRGCNVSVTVTGYDINVSANNVRIKGVGTTSDRAFKIDGNKPLQVFEECKGGDYSFSNGDFFASVSGSFVNCVGGNYSFGDYGGIDSGSFVNCVGGDYSFGHGIGNTASGSFVNCSSGYGGFSGGYGGTASGSFVNCVGGEYSFGGFQGTANGSFVNCSGGNGSFGYYGAANGSFVNCVGGEYSFAGYYGVASGIFKDCVGGEYSFGGFQGVANGSFINCSGGTGSFGGGGDGGIASGTFLKCVVTSGTFQTLSGTGKYRLCIDGNYNLINADAPPTP